MESYWSVILHYIYKTGRPIQINKLHTIKTHLYFSLCYISLRYILGITIKINI